MDLINQRLEVKNGPIAVSYAKQIINLIKKKNDGLFPTWQWRLYEPEEIGVEMAMSDISTAAFFVKSSSDIFSTVRDLFGNGVVSFNPPAKVVTFRNHADGCDIIIDNLIVCMLIPTVHNMLEDVVAKYPHILELNEMLCIYLAPEIYGNGTEGMKGPLMRCVASIDIKASPGDIMPASHKIYNIFPPESGIVPCGLWALRRHYGLRDANTMFTLLSVLPFTDTLSVVTSKFKDAVIRSTSLKIHAGHYGHKINVTSGDGKLSFDILIMAHQMVIPFVGKYELTPLFNLFIATMLFFNRKIYERDDKARQLYNSIMGITRGIVKAHFDNPKEIDHLIGLSGAVRYTLHTRQSLPIRFSSNLESYESDAENPEDNIEEFKVEITDSDGAFTLPFYLEKANDLSKLEGGEFEITTLMQKFEIVNDGV